MIEDVSVHYYVVEDHLADIFSSVGEVARASASGDRVVVDFSKLRQSGRSVTHGSGVSSGPTAFVYALRTALEHLRRGQPYRSPVIALLRLDHPDIETFLSLAARVEESGHLLCGIKLHAPAAETLQMLQSTYVLHDSEGDPVRGLTGGLVLALLEERWGWDRQMLFGLLSREELGSKIALVRAGMFLTLEGL